MANTIQSSLVGSVAAVAGGASSIGKSVSQSKESSKEQEVDQASSRAKDSLAAARKQKKHTKGYGKDMQEALKKSGGDKDYHKDIITAALENRAKGGK